MTPIYDRDGITLYHGDCLDIMPELDFGFVVTDPPYNAGKNYGKTTNDKQTWPEWCQWFDERLEQMLRADNVFACLSVTAHNQYVYLGKFMPRWTLAWHKPLALAASAIPFYHHWEPIAYWGTTNRSRKLLPGGDVLSYSVTPNRGHPTEKPLPLMADLVSRFPGVILDPFAGSGTTLRAAQKAGRQAIGIEISEEYCELIIRRLEHGVKGAAAVKRGQIPLVGAD